MSMTMPATIPMIKGRPLIGNIPEMGSDRLNFLLRMSRESDGLCAFRYGPRGKIYFVSTPELAYLMLVEKAECFDKPKRMQKDFGPIIGNGLLTSSTAFHRRQRRLVAPAFAHRRLLSYGAIMAEYAEQIQAQWGQGATLDAFPAGTAGKIVLLDQGATTAARNTQVANAVLQNLLAAPQS